MFDSLAPRYDAFNRFASLGLDVRWRRAAVRALELPADAVVLDVATGTGDLAFTAAETASRVIGLDFAPEMIEQARRKLRSGPAGRRLRDRVAPGFHLGSAEALPYRDRTFHGVTSGFAMRNVRPVLDGVLEEMRRVLRPGSRLVILEFSTPETALVRWLYRRYLDLVMPRVGALVTGSREPFDYLRRSIDDWFPPEGFAALLRERGFVEVGFRRLHLGTVALHWGRRPDG